jgi:hypothetical protein
MTTVDIDKITYDALDSTPGGMIHPLRGKTFHTGQIAVECLMKAPQRTVPQGAHQPAGRRRVLHCGVAMGGAFPNGASGTTTPTAATVSGKPMPVDYVTVYSKN